MVWESWRGTEENGAHNLRRNLWCAFFEGDLVGAVEGWGAQENFSGSSEFGGLWIKKTASASHLVFALRQNLPCISCCQRKRREAGTWRGLPGRTKERHPLDSPVGSSGAGAWHRNQPEARAVRQAHPKTGQWGCEILSAEVLSGPCCGEAERSVCAPWGLLTLGGWAGCLKDTHCDPVGHRQHRPGLKCSLRAAAMTQDQTGWERVPVDRNY